MPAPSDTVEALQAENAALKAEIETLRKRLSEVSGAAGVQTR